MRSEHVHDNDRLREMTAATATVTLSRFQFNHFFTRECSELRACAICGCNTHPTERCYVHKTKMCTHHLRGACRFAERCTFAHSTDELRQRVKSTG